jgi:PAS domain S-box-containing protein
LTQSNLHPKASQTGHNPNESSKIPQEVYFLLNAVHDPTAIVDMGGNLIALNRPFSKTTGFSEDDILGKNLLKNGLISSKSGIRLMTRSLEATARNNSCTLEIEISRKNGKRMCAEVRTTKMESAENTLVILFFCDVTERKIQEAALVELTERYLAVCEDARILVLDLDRKGNIIYSNKTAEGYGLCLKDVLGKNIMEFFGMENRSKLVSDHLCVISGQKVEEEIQLNTPKGVFKVNYVSSPVRKAGSLVGCRVTMIDTARGKLEKKLEKYAAGALILNEAYRGKFSL